MDAILNISKRSMMPEWHQLDSSSSMPQQQESTNKKTLKSSSRSFYRTNRTKMVLSFHILMMYLEQNLHKFNELV